MKLLRTSAVVGLSLLPLGALALENGNFDALDARAEGNVSYGTQGGVGFMPSWTILADDGGMIRTQPGFGAESDSAFSFNVLDTGFGANKIEQCVPIDPSQSLTLRYSINTSVSSDDVRTRLNPNFYPDMAACDVNLQVDDNSNRLSFDDSNEDFDQRLGGSAVREDQWYTIEPVVFEAGSLPDEARVMRISLRARDRSGDDAEVYLGDVRATQGESSVNLIRNGRFDHIERDDGQYLSGDAGWYLDRDQGLRASAGPLSFAQSGDNLFYFESLTGNFGASRLDQCVPLTGEDNIRPSLRVMSLRNLPQ